MPGIELIPAAWAALAGLAIAIIVGGISMLRPNYGSGFVLPGIDVRA